MFGKVLEQNGHSARSLESEASSAASSALCYLTKVEEMLLDRRHSILRFLGMACTKEYRWPS